MLSVILRGNDSMISCWICLGNYHLKCTALKAWDADVLLHPTKSLHCTCSACRNINIDFYKFFRSYKGQFGTISNEFSDLQSKLVIFGELFIKISCLDKYINDDHNYSPKRIEKSSKVQKISSLSNSSVPTAINSAKILDPNSAPSTSSSCSRPLSIHQSVLAVDRIIIHKIHFCFNCVCFVIS